jgi:DNA (cytosine-5)-methyltransferase 1
MAKKLRTAIDLFCGAGGLSEGFRQAGFTVLAGNDFDDFAGQTFSATHPDAVFIGGPIQNITAKQLLKAAGLKRGELDCLIGGPPCQAFSVYNHQRGMHDERSGLFREYLRIVEGLQPKWVVMENVTGITSVGGGQAVEEILSGLAEHGYQVETRVLKAEEYGVPQERRRILFIGNRLGLPIVWPEPTHGPDRALPYVTVWDALSDLPALLNGEDRGTMPYACPPKNDYQRYLRGPSVQVLNHSAPRLSKVNLQRMKHIPQGGSWRDIPFDLLPEGMKRAKRSDHTKRYGRIQPEGLSCTILTKCDIHWGAYIHPFQDRTLTVREAARIQSFPDWFCFAGPRTEQYVQVGNAVPPLLGRQIGLAVIEGMATHSAKQRRTVHTHNEENESAIAC